MFLAVFDLLVLEESVWRDANCGIRSPSGCTVHDPWLVAWGPARPNESLRACLKTTRGAVVVEKAVWWGATKENIPCGSST